MQNVELKIIAFNELRNSLQRGMVHLSGEAECAAWSFTAAPSIMSKISSHISQVQNHSDSFGYITQRCLCYDLWILSLESVKQKL